MISAHLSTVLYCLVSMTWLVKANKPPRTSAHGTLRFSYDTNITRVTIDHPPINLFDSLVASDLVDFLTSIQPQPQTNTSSSTPNQKIPKVVIFDSADPEFFIPHIDLVPLLTPTSPSSLNFFSQVAQIAQFLRNTTSSVFIAELNGRVSGYGDEILLQTDLRFAGPNARASQIETSVGIFPAGGGAQALPLLINRGRGLQYILSGEAVDGPTGARLGWFNEYYPSAQLLSEAVDRIAARIALNPASGLNATKAVLLPLLYPSQDVYDASTQVFIKTDQDPEVLKLVKKLIDASENQTRSAFELGLPDTMVQLLES